MNYLKQPDIQADRKKIKEDIRKGHNAFREFFIFLIVPGITAFAMPPIIAIFDPWRGGEFWPGLLMMTPGFVVLLFCIRELYVSVKNRLAPWNTPRRLVTVGLYRYVRNPMPVGVLLLVTGWTYFLLSYFLAVYIILLTLGFHIWIVRYEEPRLTKKFGMSWIEYRVAVPRWIPQKKPWCGARSNRHS